MIGSILQQFDFGEFFNWIQQSTDYPIESLTLFGVKLLNPQDFWALVIRFTLNIGVALIMIRGLYFKSNQRKDYFFIYLLMSVIVFLICFVLQHINLQMGFALGLFAIFAIIRYRTDPIPIKEMTYLFVIVGIAMINALTDEKVSIAELVFANGVVLLLTWYLERIWMPLRDEVMEINYEKIELVHPDRKEDLIEDLKIRTGLNVTKVIILRMSYLRDTAKLRVYYKVDRVKSKKN